MPTLHANALVLGEAGLLVRGPSGAGKSSLTLSLIAAAQARGRFAALVADDRVVLEEAHGRLIASPHPAIAGMIEIRGAGIVSRPFEPACVLRLVVDLFLPEKPPPRLPETDANEAILCGVAVPLLRLQSGASLGVEAILSLIHEVMTNSR